jgi:hypothetical protein
MNNSFSCSKLIAREISLVKYIAEHQLYELSITWETEVAAPSTTLYLPEQFLFPYAVERVDRKPSTQETKATDIYHQSVPNE